MIFALARRTIAYINIEYFPAVGSSHPRTTIVSAAKKAEIHVVNYDQVGFLAITCNTPSTASANNPRTGLGRMAMFGV
eukprot:scaffold4089_cov26-Prasinocladus_malaysianus.AAC.3